MQLKQLADDAIIAYMYTEIRNKNCQEKEQRF